MLIDSHCHLGSRQFAAEELEAVVQRARDAGLNRIVTLATNLSDGPQNLAIAERFPEVFSTIGIHPCDVQDSPDNLIDLLKPLAVHPRCVAIGETGLDYFHPAPEGWSEASYRACQQASLERHFLLAAELNKNIVIHTRDRSGDASLQDALEIYRRHADQVRAVFHCFPFDYEAAAPVLELGGLVSFTGIATFKNAKQVMHTACQCPAGSFMLETDAPYLAPVPHRGQRNEPAFTRHTAEAIAHARGESLESLAAHTTQTAKEFYHFPD